ncbi:hypothetical protein AbraIFM66951_000462 [Aspergillus brasiliensis]|nr:hypothetical protein AbraIFM66951_000462 [Aspergillus brasiliensis]
MYTFMLTWVTIAPVSRDHNDDGYSSSYYYYSTKNCDWVRYLPASIVNVCLLPLIIFTFARSTGGFVNPSITLAAYLLRRISLPRAAMYVGGQVVGGVLAGWAVQEASGSTAFDMGCIISSKVISVSDAYILEMIVRFAMVVPVLYLTAGRKPGVLFGDAISPWMVGIATEAAFWLSRLVWQEYPGGRLRAAL